MLNQFFSLKDTITKFFEEKDVIMTEALAKNPSFHTDVIEIIHNTNLSLQGKDTD